MDGLQERLPIEGLGYEQAFFNRHFQQGEDFPRVPRNEYRLEIRVDGLQALRQFESVQPRHAEIGDYQIDRGFRILDQDQSLLASRGFQYAVSSEYQVPF